MNSSHIPEHVVTVRGLRKSYGGRTVVDDVDLEPLKLATDAIREPWLGIGNATGPLLTVAVIALVAATLAARRTSL